MTRDEHGRPLVRIRVKERIRSEAERPVRSAGREKAILVVVGAALGLGVGFLIAGKLIGLLRPPLAEIRAAEGKGPVPAAESTVPPADSHSLEFDLPSEGE